MEKVVTIKQSLLAAKNLGIESFEAEILLAQILKKDRAYLYTYPETRLSNAESLAFQQNITKRKQGLPIAYIMQEREFWSLTLHVSPDTLIPRHETELLVEIALAYSQENLKVLELGTGSGAIAIALAHERPNWQITAIDNSIAALAIAKSNKAKYNLTNINFLHSDWFSEIPDKYNIIISNPPYIAVCDPHLDQGDLRFEPQGALSSGPDGLDALRLIIAHSSDYLLRGGILILEHGYTQAALVAALFTQNNFSKIKHYHDLSNHLRASSAIII
jgi:release factor glutamine methyltransferase